MPAASTMLENFDRSGTNAPHESSTCDGLPPARYAAASPISSAAGTSVPTMPPHFATWENDATPRSAMSVASQNTPSTTASTNTLSLDTCGAAAASPV